MGKSEIIERLKPLYLKGKSETRRINFESKPIDKQYITLMNWKSRMRRKEKENDRGEAIAEAIENVRTAIRQALGASPDDLLRYHGQIDSLHTEIDQAADDCRQRMISDLEKQQAEIADRLDALRSR